jgi:hypothetical protein
MRDNVLVATIVRGPLTADQLTAILTAFRSIHQFQPFDQFSVVFISEHLSLQLDRGPMESIVEYLEGGNNQCKRTQLLRSMTDRMAVRPRHEPEVVQSVPAPAAEPEPDPAEYFEPKPKFTARVRFNLLNGRRQEVTRAVDSLSELEWLVMEEGPYDEDLKNIKIRLEINR